VGGAAYVTASGRVHLVGAGPGDPGLLTARALQLIAEADVIVYDRLIPLEALRGARPDAELIYVGKEGGGPSVPQSETETLMIERARAGASVVRLKGGDPFVFGRGGEEALALRAAHVSFDVVPGVTAGVAAAAYAGIPVTHRGLSTAVALVTGHTRADGGDSSHGEIDLDWPALAAFPGTLVFYMGVRRLAEISRSLIAAGRDPAQAAAVVERGTLPRQRVVLGELADIAERALAAAIEAPAITVLGPVAGLADRLSWLDPRPLSGVRIAVTRARAQASGLASRLRQLGAEVIEAPTIRISPLPGPPLDPTPYDLVCLTSPNGVSLLFERIAAGGRDARSLAGATIAAIGPGTASALAEHGVVADVVPQRFVAEGLVEALADRSLRRALVARAAEGRDVLPDALRSAGVDVDVLPLYETIAEPLPPRVLRAALEADCITFTSSSAVRFFLEAATAGHCAERSADCTTSADAVAVPAVLAGGADADVERRRPAPSALLAGVSIASIGPVTSATLGEHGLHVHIEAEKHDVDGLVDTLVENADRLHG
jgi:uroporphyrinogen III methyltransferase / synthase